MYEVSTVGVQAFFLECKMLSLKTVSYRSNIKQSKSLLYQIFGRFKGPFFIMELGNCG